MFIQQLSGERTRFVTSASDLTAASACEFAFLRRVDARLGRDIKVPPDDDPMLMRAARLGDAHEDRVLAKYIDEFGRATAEHPQGVVEIAAADGRDEGSLLVAQQATLNALQTGAEVVFQATFFDPVQRKAQSDEPEIGFIGYADFLRRTASGAYEVQDTKLARRAKVTALIQLAAYAEQLERLDIQVASEATLILGDDSVSRHNLVDIAPVFRTRRARLHQLLIERARAVGADGRRESGQPVAWGAEGVRICGRCEVCEPEVQRTRDPLLIAGMRLSQRDRLMAAGYRTIDEIAAAVTPLIGSHEVEGMATATFERIVQQAAIQVGARDGAPPPYRVVNPAALAAIPEPNPGDLFFDFEGDPLYREPSTDETARWGLDYLFGMVDSSGEFTPLWAHDLEAERRALEEFLELVAERRRVHHGMRIYHYASYERTHLLSIAARHGVGEAAVDQLLRDHVLVDLYPIVRAALRIGSRSYSIKKLEPLYMADELRDDEGVTSGAQSVTEYAEASALLTSSAAEQRAEAQRRLDAIADYNRYDCVSTLRLRDWLLQLARQYSVRSLSHSGQGDQLDAGETAAMELSPVATALNSLAGRASDQRDRKAVALASSAIDYHQREQKSFWWEHFARLIEPIEDWADTRDVMVIDADETQLLHDWQEPQGRARLYRRRLRLRGEIAAGSTLKAESDVYAVYDYPAPFTQAGAQPGSRGARLIKVLERHDDGVTIEETRSKDLTPWSTLPTALTPGPPPRAGSQKGAIEQWGSALAEALEAGREFRDPVFDLMRRCPPRMTTGSGLVPIESTAAVAAVVASLRQLDHSALAVQGPPGTGKTYLAARVIRALAERHGWHIGVVAQSHKVVEHLLEGVVAAGLDPAQVAKVPQGGKLRPESEQPSFTVLGAGRHTNFLSEHRRAGRGAVIGGTAWDFSNETRVPRKSLDLLVIDEAGQFSLAPTVAASVAAERLLLLGDPQQLPQVSQGSHPEPIDASALGWLLGEHETVPENLGYFLAETRRMRPELAEVVSELSYEGRLHAHETAAQRVVEGAGPAGLVWHPVSHRANSTSSIEEAEVVVQIARDALQSTISELGQPTRALSQRDIIVVAAYNAQVECLSEQLSAAGFAGIRVGTVDKFQGQEAVIAIVSLAASSESDVPRGLEFLIMRNRLNVAISRAQWAAHLVSSDRLGDSLPSTSEGVAALSGYLQLLERSAAPSANV